MEDGNTETVRVNFNMPLEEHSRFHALLPHGIRGHVLNALCLKVVDATERHGNVILGAIMDGKFRIEPVLGGKDAQT